MPNTLVEYQLRIRNAANSADALTITSVRGGTNPWLESAPRGDGEEFNPLSGASRCGAFTGTIVDGITSGTTRVVTSQLEDAGLRQQLMDRRAFVEFREDGGSWIVLIAGYLTSLKLDTGAVYSYTVSDPTRVEHEYLAFAAKADSANPDNLESIAAYLARWPNRGCIFGGPVIGGFLKQADRNGWEMQAIGQDSGITYLKFVAGYGPPKFERSTKVSDVAGDANAATDPLFGSARKPATSVATFEQAEGSNWPGVIVEVLTSAGVSLGYFQPNMGLSYAGTGNGNLSPDGLYRHLIKDIRSRGVFITTTSLTTGTTSLRVRAFTARVSDLAPIYHTAHPVDWLDKLWTEAGLSFSASALTTTRAAIGADWRLACRISAPQPLGDFLERNVYGPFGIGVRTNDAGELEAFASRTFLNTLPSVTIGAADVQRPAGETSPPAFYINQASAIRKVTFEHERLILTQDSVTGGVRVFIHGNTFPAVSGSSPDGFVTQVERFEFTNRDSGAVGNRSQEYTVAGMIYSTSSNTNSPDLYNRLSAVAKTIFDRYGRGLVEGECHGLRGGSTDPVKLGDEILNNIPQLPNHNKRLGDDLSVSARAMQVVRITKTPSGPLLKLADSGPNAQPYATVPTHTIAASATFPRTIAQLTITNAATLNADSAGVRVQMAVTTGAVPALTDYVDVVAFDAGQIPTTAFSLPALVSGRTVYARARAEKPGSRPSNWSNAVSVTLTAVPPVTSLVAASRATDGSLEQLTWTAGDATSTLDIYLRASGAAATDAVRVNAIPPGSNRYLLENLTPGTAYTAGVQARDESTGDLSTMVEVTFTTAATTATLAAPVYPFAFAGSFDETGVPQRDGVFGMAVVAAVYPGLVEVQIAVETSVASGVYGAFATSGTVVASVLGNWTIWQDIAPNDGLRRQIKARHTREGTTASAYTATVTVTPWTPQGLPGYPTDMVCEVTALAPTEPGVNVRLQVTGVDPTGLTPQVKIISLSSNVGVVSGGAVATLQSNNNVWRLSQPGPGQGPGSALFSAVAADGRFAEVSWMIPEQTTLAEPQAVGDVTADGFWSVTVNGPANALSFRYLTSTSGFPADASVTSSGTLVSGTRSFTVSGGPLSFGQTIYVTAIPYTGAFGAGFALPSCGGRASYLTYTASKTLYYSRASFTLRRVTGFSPWISFDSSQGPTNDAMQGNTIPLTGATVAMNVALPLGVVLASARFDYVWNVAGTPLESATAAVYRAGSLVNSGALSYGGGAQSVSISLSGTTGAGDALMLAVLMAQLLPGTADAGQLALRDVSVSYTMPDPKKTI